VADGWRGLVSLARKRPAIEPAARERTSNP
jgi:hypothetical protein